MSRIDRFDRADFEVRPRRAAASQNTSASTPSVTVPAPAVPQLLEDAIARGVPYVHLFTSGFGETGDTDRAELAQRVLARAREAGGFRTSPLASKAEA